MLSDNYKITKYETESLNDLFDIRSMISNAITGDSKYNEVAEQVWEVIDDQLEDEIENDPEAVSVWKPWTYFNDGSENADVERPTQAHTQRIIKDYGDIVRKSLQQIQFKGEVFTQDDNFDVTTDDKSQRKLIDKVTEKSGLPRWYVTRTLYTLYKLTLEEKILDKSFLFPKFGKADSSRTLKIAGIVGGLAVASYFIYRRYS